jgi:hypothetical protein
VVELNPAWVTAQRRVNGSARRKTGVIDVDAIADLIRAGRGYAIARASQPLVELQAWVPHRRRRVLVRSGLKNQLTGQLDRALPGLGGCLSSVTTTLTIDGESVVKLPGAERWRRQTGEAVPTDPLSAALTSGDPTALLDLLADGGNDLRVSSVDIAGVAATRYEGPSSLTDLVPAISESSPVEASAIAEQDVVVHVVVEDDTNLLRAIGITIDAGGTAFSVVLGLSDFGGPDPLQRPDAVEIDEDA